jgi:Kef-type K+ transport system membrane component KefB
VFRVDNHYLVAALWIGLALTASLVSIRLGVSVALIEIALGVLAGNSIGLSTTPWVDVLAGFGSVILTFLAGAEIDPDSLRRHLKSSLAIGFVSFAAPFAAAWAFALFVAGWDMAASQIAGIALSTTSVAVVYAVMIESGLASQEIGKRLLAACFVTDLGTVLALGILFADLSPLLLVFGAVTAVVLLVVGRATRWVVERYANRVSEPETKFLLLVLFGLGGLAAAAKSEAVLPAYLLGLVVAGVLAESRLLVERIRAIAFSLLTPFYFIKAGLFVSLPAVVAGAGLVAAFFFVKVGSKILGVWPTSRAFGLAPREANYTTLLMSTGLTFGTISALFGLTHGYIDQAAYTILVTVVILSAVVPTLIATTFFQPAVAGEAALEEFDAAEEIDAGLLPRPGSLGSGVAVPVADGRRSRVVGADDERTSYGEAESA